MDVQLINQELLRELHEKAAQNERLRMNFDLRTTPEDTSQRMLNALQPGTHIPIHRHLKTSETVICLEGQFGIQVPLGAWHSVEVYEPSTILEAKDGAYGTPAGAIG